MSSVVLPEGWCDTKLGAAIDYGKAVKKELSQVNSDMWILELEDIEKDSSKLIQRVLVADRPFKSTKNSFSKGDILYGKLRPYLNKVIIADTDGVCTTEIIPINGEPLINNKFLFYWLRSESFLSYVNAVSYGVNMPRLGTTDGLAAPFYLAPLAEQKVIAAKLDELLAQVDILKTRLTTIPTLLKRFRQSVLAAAVSGKLTEEWRGNCSYKLSELEVLFPDSWDMLKIEDIGEVKGGKRLPLGESLVSHNTGYPYIRAGQLKNGSVLESDQLYLEAHVQKQISRYVVAEGDAYITIVGACIGDAGIIPKSYSGANLTENAAKICDYKRDISSQFLSHWLRSQYLQDLIQNEIKSGAQGKLALKRIKTLPIPYPKINEQTEIVRRVELLFAFADQIEQQVKNAQSRVNNLTQSILAKAFRGELTADWRTANPDLITGENSAQALLAKIKTERDKPKKVTKQQVMFTE